MLYFPNSHPKLHLKCCDSRVTSTSSNQNPVHVFLVLNFRTLSCHELGRKHIGRVTTYSCVVRVVCQLVVSNNLVDWVVSNNLVYQAPTPSPTFNPSRMWRAYVLSSIIVETNNKCKYAHQSRDQDSYHVNLPNALKA